MTKKDNIFEFLVEYITARVVNWIARDSAVNSKEAFTTFLNSETFQKLSEPDTGMYIESPAYIYAIYNQETNRATLRGLTD